MLRYAIIASACLSAAAVAAAPPVQMEKDGYRFEYVTKLDRNDIVRIEGRWLDTRQDFKLRVSPRGRVRGTVGSRPVSFAIGQKRRDSLLASVKRAEALGGGRIPVAEARPASR